MAGRGVHATLAVLLSLCVACSAANLPRPGLLRSRRVREEQDDSPSSNAAEALADDLEEMDGRKGARKWLIPLIRLAKEATTLTRSPGLWIIVTTIYVTHTRGRREKREDMREIRDQVFLGKDYHMAIVTTAALPWMTGTVRPDATALQIAIAPPPLHPFHRLTALPHAFPHTTLRHLAAPLWLPAPSLHVRRPSTRCCEPLTSPRRASG